MPHTIDHAILRRAAEHLLDIADAGGGERLMTEYYARRREAGLTSSYRDPWRESELDRQARRLAIVTDAPLHQCQAAVREASGDMQTRALGLELLAERAADVRRARARQRRERRCRT